MSTAATKRRIGVVSTVVVALVASLLVWMATRSEGEVVRKADLNDGGVWVTSSEQSRGTIVETLCYTGGGNAAVEHATVSSTY